MKFEQETDVVIKGPCTLTVKDGKLVISGIELEAGESLSITQNYFTLTSIKSTEVETDCQIIASYKTLGWYNVAKEIGGKILVLGEQNSGKTYFSNLVLNIQGGALIDADVGQSSLFLPTFIAYTDDSSKKLLLSERKVKGLEFFGDITPSTNPRLHVALIALALKKISSNNMVIDTDGWVTGFQAYRHKVELAYVADPDYIIVFSPRLLSDLPEELVRKTKLLKPFPLNVDRDREKRRNYRVQKYKDYFSNAKVVKIYINQLLGLPVSKNLLKAWEQTLQLVDEQPCIGFYIDREELKGLLLGLTYKGEVVGAGILNDIKEEENVIEVLTPVEKFDGGIIGEIGLNEDFTEKRVRIKKCLE